MEGEIGVRYRMHIQQKSGRFFVNYVFVVSFNKRTSFSLSRKSDIKVRICCCMVKMPRMISVSY